MGVTRVPMRVGHMCSQTQEHSPGCRGGGVGVEELECGSSPAAIPASRPFSPEARGIPCSWGPTGTCKLLLETLPEGGSGDLGESDRRRHSF